MKVGIVGAGFVGSTAAFAMVTTGAVNEVVLVDMNEALSRVDGDALAAEFERYLRRRGPGFRG